MGLLIVLSSPSGGGKTVIAQKLLRADKNVIRSISCTTRLRRRGEKNGRDYFFVSTKLFKRMVSQKRFLEWAQVHDHYYGTPRSWVSAQMKKGKDVLLVIDVQGGKAIRRQCRNSVLIFVVPPSFRVLKKRLMGRRSDDVDAIKVRLKNAHLEMKEGRHYDYRVVNNQLGRAVSEVKKIIRKERQKSAARKRH
jgi:guanylate kinase